MRKELHDDTPPGRWQRGKRNAAPPRAPVRPAKPWRTKAWKERRAVLLQRTAVCEWCEAVPCKGNPLCVHHHDESHHPQYQDMRDADVSCICRRCHYQWTMGEVRRTPEEERGRAVRCIGRNLVEVGRHLAR